MIYNLQYLRAFAAIIVVIFHITINDSISENIDTTLVYGFFSNWGASGVDLFFVLSGFIMVFIQDQKHRSASDFILGRIVRVVPLYWFVTIGWCLLVYITSPYFRENLFSFEKIISSLVFAAQVMGYNYPFIVPGWTLEYEAAFYLMFAVSILTFKTSYFYPLLIGILLISISTSSTPLFVEFGFGMIAAKLHRTAIVKTTALAMFVVGVMTFFFGAFSDVIYQMEGFHRGWSRVIVWGVPSFLIVLSASSLKQYSFPLLLYFGGASYSIYLTHRIAITIYTDMIEILPAGIVPGLLSVFLCFAFSVGLGCIFYSFFEKPTARFLGKLRRVST